MTSSIENKDGIWSSENQNKHKSENTGFVQLEANIINLPSLTSDTSHTLPKKHRISDNESSSALDDDETPHQQAKTKKQKRVHKPDSNKYPSMTFSKNCRLSAQIEISDLQSLILYILADGKSPRFISICHRMQIRKVVVLMIPGLELSMFSEVHCQGKTPSFSSPDYYYPRKLEIDKLSGSLKLFAKMFDYVWPVKTPGDDRYMKMHSPLHAMLTAPLTKSMEENRERKSNKGSSLVKKLNDWNNKPVIITDLVHTADELLENDYVLHPVCYSDKDQKSMLAENLSSVKALKDHSWVDSHVTKFEIKPILGPDTEPNSVTAGWEVFAVDCEMCMTGEAELSLTRISILDWNGSVILDELVKPEKQITNYLTQ